MTLFDYDSVPEFRKDIKKLRIPSIENDLILFQTAFSTDKTDITGLVRIPNLEKKGVKTPIYKARTFRCKFLNKGSRSGIRVILTYDIEQDKVTYIEIYKKKDDTTNHDEDRILRHFRQ